MVRYEARKGTIALKLWTPCRDFTILSRFYGLPAFRTGSIIDIVPALCPNWSRAEKGPMSVAADGNNIRGMGEAVDHALRSSRGAGGGALGPALPSMVNFV